MVEISESLMLPDFFLPILCLIQTCLLRAFLFRYPGPENRIYRLISVLILEEHFPSCFSQLSDLFTIKFTSTYPLYFVCFVLFYNSTSASKFKKKLSRP